jgi:preprotein translocase subunit SecD
MGTPFASAMTTAALRLKILPQCVFAALLAAGGLFAQEKEAEGGEQKPAAEAPAPPAPSKDLTGPGGAWFFLRVVPADGKLAPTEAMEQTADSIRRRLSPADALDVIVTSPGNNLLYAEVPRLTPGKMEAARATVQKPAVLAFHLTGPEGLEGMTTAEDKSEKPGLKKLHYLDAGWKEKDANAGKWLWVQEKPALSGRLVQSATPIQHPGAVSHSLYVSLHKEAGERMRELSKAQLGKPLAIVLDGEVLSAPIIRGEFGADFHITGLFTEEETATLSTLLANPFPLPVTLLNSGTVPPASKKP